MQYIDIGGERLSLSDVAKKAGITRQAVMQRLAKDGINERLTESRAARWANHIENILNERQKIIDKHKPQIDQLGRGEIVYWQCLDSRVDEYLYVIRSCLPLLTVQCRRLSRGGTSHLLLAIK